MDRWSVWVAALVVGASAGCLRDLPALPRDAGPEAASVPEAGGSLSDVAARPHDAGGGDRSPDEPGKEAPGAHRWRANGPTGEREEGEVVFALECMDPEGLPAACSFVCKLDSELPQDCEVSYTKLWAGVGPYREPRRHEFCVTATPRPGTAPAAARGSTTCRAWTATPYTRPFTWVREPLPSDRTELKFVPRCAQAGPDGSRGEPREDCTFRFSIDDRPYVWAPHGDDGVSVQFSQLEPGPHVLRAEVYGPPRALPEVWDITTVRWTVAAGAQPEVVDTPWSVPPLMSREELDGLGLGRLLEPYGAFARACKGNGDPLVYEEELRTYLSYGFGVPHVTGPLGENRVAHDSTLDACLQQLNARPAECRSLPGMRRNYLAEGPLSVRLPDRCMQMTRGGSRAGHDDICLTSVDCQGDVCEYDRSWWPEEPVRGYCGSSGPEPREGIMCRSRGCEAGMYCDGSVCRRVLAPRAPCNRAYQGDDCPAGFTCASGDEPLCVRASARLGDACRFDRDCTEGLCLTFLHVCGL